MALTIFGKVVKVLPEETGEGKNGTWKKQSFVIETEGEYPKTVCFEGWAQIVDHIKHLKIGMPITVYFAAESREYNERFYTSLRAYKLESKQGKVAQSEVAPPPPVAPPVTSSGDDELPF